MPLITIGNFPKFEFILAPNFFKGFIENKSIITSLKLYPGLKNKFLKKIIGLEKYPYLSAETI